jgi:hypothetical protein
VVVRTLFGDFAPPAPVADIFFIFFIFFIKLEASAEGGEGVSIIIG